MSWAMIMNPTGERFMPSTHRSISPWPPCSANTAENSAEPTNSQHTMAVVLAVRNVDSFRFRRSSGGARRYQRPGTTVPRKAPPIEAATSSDIQAPRPATSRARTPRAAPTRVHHQTCARVARHHGEVQRAQRADRRRLGGGADAEQDHGEHHDGQHAERHHRRDQLLQDLELLAVHAPEVDESSERGEPRPAPRTTRRSAPGILATVAAAASARPATSSPRVARRRSAPARPRISAAAPSSWGASSASRRRRGSAGATVGEAAASARDAAVRRGRRDGGRRVVDDDVPPRHAEGARREQHGHRSASTFVTIRP